MRVENFDGVNFCWVRAQVYVGHRRENGARIDFSSLGINDLVRQLRARYAGNIYRNDVTRVVCFNGDLHG